jgi:4,5-DOPA dioxygenase extradiol
MSAMPAIFFGHGNPMNALLDNSYTQAWQRIGQQTTKPKAIISISAHWFVPEQVSPSVRPRELSTISAVSRESCIGCNIQRPAIPI